MSCTPRRVAPTRGRVWRGATRWFVLRSMLVKMVLSSKPVLAYAFRVDRYLKRARFGRRAKVSFVTLLCGARAGGKVAEDGIYSVTPPPARTLRIGEPVAGICCLFSAWKTAGLNIEASWIAAAFALIHIACCEFVTICARFEANLSSRIEIGHVCICN